MHFPYIQANYTGNCPHASIRSGLPYWKYISNTFRTCTQANPHNKGPFFR